MASPDYLSPLKKRLLERLLRAEAQHQVREAPIEPRSPKERVPLAPCQHQIWLHAQLAPQAPLYNGTMTLHFTGPLDRAALERAMDEMIQRHEIWRTTFAYIDGQVVQAIHDRRPIEIPFHDLTSFPEAAREQEAIRLATADARRPFDLGIGPLMRARLVKLDEDQYQLFLVQHHLIHDGVTIYGVLMSELPAIYDAFSKNQPSPLPLPKLQYADFALWQKRSLENDTGEQLAYWRKQLAGEVPPLNLPADRLRPAVFSFRGAAADFAVPAGLAAAVRETAQREGVTPFALMLAVLKTLLFRYTGNQDLVVGTFTDVRRRAEFERTAGFLMNTLVLRTRPSAGRTFRDYLHEVQDTVLDGLSHRDVPLDRVVRELQWQRDPIRHPVFQTSFTLVPPLPIPDARWKRTESEVSAGAAKWDLDFLLDERDGGYAARVTYSTDLFDAATIERFFAHWLALLEGAMRNPAARLIDLPLMTKEETEEICIRRNATRREVPACTISQLFEQQVIRTPNAVSVECGTSSLTYAELNREANRLAYRLRDEGAGPGTVVALCVERSCDMVVSVLAVLKAGAAYLPLAPEIPPERKRLILEDSQAPFLVTEPEFLNQFREFAPANLHIVCCGEGKPRRANLGPIASSENLAYILYTSGSTGKPKGVEVPHSAVVNFLESMRRRPGFSARDTLLAVTTLSFDIAALEIYLPLICGGRVVLANPSELSDLALLQDLIEHLNPSVMQATPATWRALVDAGWKGSRELKILCGGESLTRELADQLLIRSAELWNMYGPTETTIWSTIHRVMPGDDPVPIGRPIDNTQVYVLDSEQRPVPDGVAGELYIGGHGVARGYLRREQLTAERFVMVEAAGNTRLYRTGDIARWRSDGTLECLGRADNQVKIRGFRVELEEIEAVLAQHPDVRGAAVAAWPDASGNLALAGYIVTGGNPDLRDFLRDRLPEYMIPSVFVRMRELPLTSNRKIDRRKLPPPALRREFVPADLSETEEERRLAAIWESVLGLANIGVNDDFFRSGGHSLLVPKLLSRVEQTFGLRLPMASLFEAPSIRKFARLLKNPSVPAAPVRTVSIRKDSSQRPLIWLYPGAEMRQIIKHLRCPVVGVALSPQDEAALPPDFTYEQIAAHLVREVRAAQPEGPYLIGGWCSSGILAYEVASQLRLQGVDVATLILIDSLNPAKYLEMGARRRRISKVKYHLKRIAALERGRVGDYVRERVAWARRRFRPRFSSLPASYEDRYSHATLKYVPPSYSGRVLVLRPERMPSYRDPFLHWGEAVTGELQCRIVRGDHMSMFEEGAADLAAEIMAAVAASEAEPSSGVSSNVAAFHRRIAAVNT